MIKKIRQKRRTGCSVASIAMLMGVTYEKALKALYPKRKPYQRMPGNAETIVKALKRLGADIEFYSNLTKLLGLEDEDAVEILSLKKPALLAIYMRDKQKGNHAVVWDPSTKKVIDPGRKRNMPVSYYQGRLSFVVELK